MLARIAIAAVASASMVTGALSWDGARAYHLRPEGMGDISLTSTFVQAEGTINLGGPVSELEVGVTTPTYHQTFDAFGNVGQFLIGLPVGGVSLETSPYVPVLDVDTGIAQGDLVIGGALGLVGMPALSPIEYATQHKPGFQAMVESKLFLPTGDYDPNRIVNLGLNRWTLEASLPISYALGDSMLDPELTTFEIRPIVVVFGDNEDPYVGLAADTSSQDPIFAVEAHVTRNFGNSVWAALDGYYETGGQITADGVTVVEDLETLSLGATLGLVLSPSLAIRASYRELVHSNVPDASARTLQVTTAFLF